MRPLWRFVWVVPLRNNYQGILVFSTITRFTKALMKILICTSLLIFSLAAAKAVTDFPNVDTSIAEIESHFADPPTEARPGFYWHWPGGGVEPVEIERELRGMKAQGFSRVTIVCIDHIHWNGTEYGFGNAAWQERVKFTIEKAAELGMSVTVSPTPCWPFTYDGPEPERVASLEIATAQQVLQGPTTYKGKVPQVAIPVEENGKHFYRKANPDGPDLGWIGKPLPSDIVQPPVTLCQATLARADHAGSAHQALEPARVVTSQIDKDGNIAVEIPPGSWILTGYWTWPIRYQRHGEYPNGAGGYIVSMWDREAMSRFLDYRLGPVLSSVAPALVGPSFRAVYLDNPEGWKQSWSWNFLHDFQTLRGYDLTPWLPVLFDKTAPSPASDDLHSRLAADVDVARKEMCSLNGYGGMTAWCESHGLLSREEGHDPANGDYEDNYGAADVPEFEVIYGENHQRNALAALSGAHVYGRRLVATESFTYLAGREGWGARLDTTRRAAANIFGWGSNQINFHSYTYTDPSQPYPGWYFRASSNVNERTPFFPYMRPLADYLARNCLVMQAGNPVVDLLWLSPGYDNKAMDAIRQQRQTLLGGTLKADGATELGFVHNTTSMEDGTLRLGLCRYRLVVVSSPLELKGLTQLKTLVTQGLNVYFADGSLPTGSRYFDPTGKRNAEIATLGRELLGDISDASPKVMGKGRIWYGKFAKLDDVLSALKIGPQIAGPADWKVTDCAWQQRQGADFDAFYLNNTSDVALASSSWWFRAKGSTAELWDAKTGAMAALPLTPEGDGVRTSFPLAGRASALLIVRRDHPTPKPAFTEPAWRNLQSITGTWEVDFQHNGEPPLAHLTLPALVDWQQLQPVQKFAGTGVYHLQFSFEGQPKPGEHYSLSLHQVCDVAQVSLNGKDAGTVIEEPYRVDVTGLLKHGDNTLVIQVANRYANYAGPHFSSGLLGPVTLEAAVP